jgi:ABC-type nitrate/sulfonate/bicarbonate transport system ATPase subunit
MEIQGVPAREARDRALPYMKRYGLGGFENQYPSALSGGMRQRAALLRTLLLENDIVLLDEPFGALDAQTKAQMQEWLLQIWADFGKTVIFVTHDVDESIYLSDEVCVMGTRPGRVIERLTVTLPRPRPRSIVNNADFISMKQTCMDLLNQQYVQAELAEAV